MGYGDFHAFTLIGSTKENFELSLIAKRVPPAN